MDSTTGVSRLYARLHSRQIPALDGIRMIAVFLVIFLHFGLPVPGGHGVMAFFVLSGFLITWLLLEEHDRTGTISLRGFYRRRTVRIFPAFYAFWLLIVMADLLRGRAGMPWDHAWSSFFYVSNYYSALNHHPENGFSHTWSLAIEEQFYLLWPFVFLRFRHDLRRMTTLLVAVIAIVGIHRAMLSAVFEVDQSYIYSALDTRIDQLLIGCLLAVLLKRRVLAGFWERATANAVLPLVTLAAILASIYVGPMLLPRYRHVIGFTFEPLLMAVFLAQAVALSATPGWSWLDAAPVRYLGRISYSLYLYQQITLYPVRRILAAYPMPVQLLAAVAVTVIIASLSYYAIERPFLRWKHPRTAPRPLEAPATAAV